MVEALRTRHYSRRTEEAYLHWSSRFIRFHNGKHPRELAEPEVNRFLTHLAVEQNVAASTQNQALAALLFLYGHVLEKPLNRVEGVVRARRPKRLPVVLTPEEVEAVLAEVEGDLPLSAFLFDLHTRLVVSRLYRGDEPLSYNVVTQWDVESTGKRSSKGLSTLGI